jgi:hypothetical protein
LRFVAHPAAAGIAERAQEFLEHEMLGPGLWTYWSSKGKIRVPADLDDIACASLALSQWGRSVPDNRQFLLDNRDEHGRFLTWLVDCKWNPQDAFLPPRHRLNVDVVVNANVVAYLGERAETRAAIDYLVGVLGSSPIAASAYYPDTFALFHAVSRAYQRGVKGLAVVRDSVVSAVAARVGTQGAGNALLDAQAMLTLLNFNSWSAAGDIAFEALLRHQQENGAWPRVAAYLGPAPFYGSEEVTTAYALEAVARFAALSDAPRGSLGHG